MPEVADILRRHGDEYLTRFGRVLPSHRRAMRDIVMCRTAALGGELWRCPGCEGFVYRYHSCRNRACPKCHRLQTESWLAARRGELVEAPYFHVVFTVPEELRRVIRSRQRVLYDVVVKAAAQALQELARNRRFCGGEIAVLAVLHTATRALEYHPHVHVLVPGVGLGRSGELCRARQGYFVPVRALSKLFAGKFLSMAREALAGDVVLPRVRRKWVVYCKPAVQGADRVLEYLGRYVFRPPLSNRHIVGLDDGVVRLRYRANQDHEWRTMALAVDEFLRRFLQHVLPRGLHKVRYFGLWHPARRVDLARLQQLAHEEATDGDRPAPPERRRRPPAPVTCPQCGCDRLLHVGRLQREYRGRPAADRAPPPALGEAA